MQLIKKSILPGIARTIYNALCSTEKERHIEKERTRVLKNEWALGLALRSMLKNIGKRERKNM
jgi:hypothetical protein